MRSKKTRAFGLASAALCAALTTWEACALPAITGTPTIDAPKYLDWPADYGTVTPNLDNPTSNLLDDLHANITECDLVLSTEGNYHMALREMWPIFLSRFGDDPPKNWFYTTSPPVVVSQIQNGTLEIGNFYSSCRPSVAVANRSVIDQLVAAGQTDGPSYPLYQDRGAVILVKKGNPKGIRSVWDLGRHGVHVVTPNPTLEPGAFNNYATSFYEIARNNAQHARNMSVDELFDAVYNNRRDPEKWLAGPRIHHRDVPWSIAHGKADAGLFMYHLARYATTVFPEQFEIVPLGGSAQDPQPLVGNQITTRYVVALKGSWNARQQLARDLLVQTLLSPDFTLILENNGLRRPAGP